MNLQGLTYIDLFAGIGGFHQALSSVGATCVFASEWDKYAAETYYANYNIFPEGDITKIEASNIPAHDILCGGFPCQAFSISGKQKGFEDARGTLFFDIARIVKHHQPKMLFLENVRNFERHDGGNTLKVILKTLDELGYHVNYKVLNASDYNLPQNRERIYLVCFRKELNIENFEFPKSIKLTKKVADLLEESVPEKYYYNAQPLYQRLKDFVKEEGKVYQWRRQYVRENKSGVCPTLTANMGTGGHNVPIIKDKKGIRKLTPLECFRIQGFPKNYILPTLADSALYKQAGNSVSVPVIEAVAKQMMKAME